MALGFRTGLLTGLGISLVAAFALPRWGRPAAKATIKGGIAAYESAGETIARLRETLEDITAEAAYERAVEQAAASEASRAAGATAAAPRDTAQRNSEEAQPATAC
jgi:Protein of unknown function (DUF5132)